MTKNPLVASGLSLILPGAGQIYAGQAKKGGAVALSAFGAAMVFLLSRAEWMRFLALFIYASAMFSSAVESYQTAKHGRAFRILQSKTYVVFMLLTTGFSALPLLWQSDFSRAAKIGWTVAVPLLALAFFAVLAQFSPAIDRMIENGLHHPV